MSTHHELEIMTHYEPMLWRIVHNFMSRCSMHTMQAEDLIQEARIAFLMHIRTHRPEDYGRCRLTIWHALCDAVRAQYPVSMPHGVFTNKEKRGTVRLVDVEYMAQALASDEEQYEAVELAAQIMHEVETFPEEATKLVHLKMKGYTNREAAQRLGMTDYQVSRTLKRIRRLLEGDVA